MLKGRLNKLWNFTQGDERWELDTEEQENMDRVNVTASILLKCGPIFGVWRLHIQIQVQLKDGAVQGNEKQDH